MTSDPGPDPGQEGGEKSLYELLGGESAIRSIVESFYRNMDRLPEAQGIRAMHPKDLSTSIEKLFMFITGWTGGPSLFIEKYGHPMLRKRHFPFAIGKSERDQWMLCMVLALEEVVSDEELRSFLNDRLMALADHMRNREEAGHSS